MDNSKKRFVRNRFIDFFNQHFEDYKYTLYDPKYAMYDVQRFEWSIVFPSKVQDVLKEEITTKERHLIKIRKLQGKNLYDGTDIFPQVIDLRTQKWSKNDKNFLVDIYLNNNYTFLDEIDQSGKIVEFDYSVIQRWFSVFCRDVFNGTGFNNVLGSWLVYSWDIMKKRAELLKEDKSSFYEERDILTKERERYSEFGDLFIANRDGNWSIKQFLCAIVAEQSLRVFEENYDVEYTIGKREENPFALEIIPFLKMVGIIDNDGNIVIRTMSELNQAISSIPQKILDGDDWDLLNEYIKTHNGTEIFTVHDDSVLSVNGEVHYFDKDN